MGLPSTSPAADTHLHCSAGTLQVTFEAAKTLYLFCLTPQCFVPRWAGCGQALRITTFAGVSLRRQETCTKKGLRPSRLSETSASFLTLLLRSLLVFILCDFMPVQLHTVPFPLRIQQLRHQSCQLKVFCPRCFFGSHAAHCMLSNQERGCSSCTADCPVWLFLAHSLTLNPSPSALFVFSFPTDYESACL